MKRLKTETLEEKSEEFLNEIRDFTRTLLMKQAAEFIEILMRDLESELGCVNDDIEIGVV